MNLNCIAGRDKRAKHGDVGADVAERQVAQKHGLAFSLGTRNTRKSPLPRGPK